jgi:hypothetical protein
MRDDDYAEAVRGHMVWARNVMFRHLSDMVERVADVPDPKVRANLFSAMLGVSLGSLRDAAVRLDLARPAVVEMIASIEIAREAHREGEVAKREHALMERAKDQVPS